MAAAAGHEHSSTGKDGAMGAGEPVVDQTALAARVPGYIYARIPAADRPAAGGAATRPDDDGPLGAGWLDGESEQRRERYAWLYEDEDLWASPQP
jgi:hypothetical protein